jgi:hypothetical protein
MRVGNVVLLLSILWPGFLFGTAAERRRAVPRQELQDPGSEHHVPVPYPRTRADIVADFQRAVWTYCGPALGTWPSREDWTLLGVLRPESGIHVAEILQVANRTVSVPGDFFFLLIVRDRAGTEVARWSLTEYGAYFGGSIPPQGFTRALWERAAARKAFAKVLPGIGIRSMTLIFLANELAPYPFAPTWELTCGNGGTYYLDANGAVYRLRRTMGHADRRKLKPDRFPATNGELVVADPRYDRLLFLERRGTVPAGTHFAEK